MLKRILPVLVTLGVLLTACGPQGTPTPAPADVQNTAIAAAWTLVAMTQAAIPTATPLPPTETPSPTSLPTFTQEVLPSFTPEQLILPTATQAATGKCEGLLDIGQAGPQSDIRIDNDSGGTVEWVALWLSPNLFGQCGNISPNKVLKSNENVRMSLPKGTWSICAGVSFKGGGSSAPCGGFTLGVGFDDIVIVKIKKDNIVAH